MEVLKHAMDETEYAGIKWSLAGVCMCMHACLPTCVVRASTRQKGCKVRHVRAWAGLLSAFTHRICKRMKVRKHMWLRVAVGGSRDVCTQTDIHTPKKTYMRAQIHIHVHSSSIHSSSKESLAVHGNW